MGKLVLFCLFYISPVYKLHLLLPLQSLYQVVGLSPDNKKTWYYQICSLYSLFFMMMVMVMVVPGGDASEDDAEP